MRRMRRSVQAWLQDRLPTQRWEAALNPRRRRRQDHPRPIWFVSFNVFAKIVRLLGDMCDYRNESGGAAVKSYCVDETQPRTTSFSSAMDSSITVQTLCLQVALRGLSHPRPVGGHPGIMMPSCDSNGSTQGGNSFDAIFAVISRARRSVMYWMSAARSEGAWPNKPMVPSAPIAPDELPPAFALRRHIGQSLDSNERWG